MTSSVIKMIGEGDVGANLDIHMRENRGKTMNMDARRGRKLKVIYTDAD